MLISDRLNQFHDFFNILFQQGGQRNVFVNFAYRCGHCSVLMEGSLLRTSRQEEQQTQEQGTIAVYSCLSCNGMHEGSPDRPARIETPMFPLDPMSNSGPTPLLPKERRISSQSLKKQNQAVQESVRLIPLYCFLSFSLGDRHCAEL